VKDGKQVIGRSRTVASEFNAVLIERQKFPSEAKTVWSYMQVVD
jgi:hypothetical protein